MFKIFARSQPLVPIVYIDAHVNQLNAANLLKKLRKSKYHSAKAIAVVCSISNNMPVQVDKLYQQIQRIKSQYKIPIYSFLADQCNPQSYYMASSADFVYCEPSTIFNLHHTNNKFLWNDLFNQLNLKNYTIKSGSNLNGSMIDQFTSPNTSSLINKKDNNIDQRLFSQAVINRLAALKKQQNNQLYQQIKTKSPQKIPDLIIGEDAIKLGLVDHIGEHNKILKQNFPQCRFEVIKYKNEPKMKWSYLIALFVIKGTIKWTLILYLWMKSKEKNNKTQSTNNNSSK